MDELDYAIQLMNNGNVDEARDTLKRFVLGATDEEKFIVSELYYDWGFIEDAVVLLKKLLDIYPQEGQLITKLSEMYIDLEKDESAIDLLNGINEDDSYYLQSLLHLADLYQTQGLFEVSEQKLLEAKQLAPDEIVIDFALGELLFSIGQYNRAIPFYEKVIVKEEEINNVSINERLAESHALLGHYQTALTYYEKIDNKDPDTLFKYGFTAFREGRNDIAINIWKQLIEKDPNYHTVYTELATALKDEGLMEDAYSIIQQGLMYDEFNKELYFLAAQIALSLQKQEESIDFLKEAILLDSDYREAVLLLIRLYKEDGQYANIIDLVHDIQKMGASDPLYDWELARAFKEEEEFSKALNAYEEAYIPLSDDKDFLKEYGYFLVEEGMQREAINALDQYIALDPMDEETISFVERLKFSIND